MLTHVSNAPHFIILSSSAGLTIWQKRHMPRAPRLPSSILFPNFLFPVSARGPNSAPVRGPKEPKSPRKREAPKVGPQTFFCSLFQRKAQRARGPQKTSGLKI